MKWRTSPSGLALQALAARMGHLYVVNTKRHGKALMALALLPNALWCPTKNTYVTKLVIPLNIHAQPRALLRVTVIRNGRTVARKCFRAKPHIAIMLWHLAHAILKVYNAYGVTGRITPLAGMHNH